MSVPTEPEESTVQPAASAQQPPGYMPLTATAPPGQTPVVKIAPPRRPSAKWWATAIVLPLITLIVLGTLWYSDNSSLNTRLNTLNIDLASTQRERDTAKQEAAHPTLAINN